MLSFFLQSFALVVGYQVVRMEEADLEDKFVMIEEAAKRDIDRK